MLHALVGVLLYFSVRRPAETNREKELKFATESLLADSFLAPLTQQI
jgi:hypothetical protein